MRNFISTPNIGLKRELGKHFKVLTLDEHKTSCINYKTKEPNKNLYINNNKIHPVLILTEKNGAQGCTRWNRFP